MKFLVMTTIKSQPPPDMLPALHQASQQWAAEARKSGKLDALYSISGQSGGMAIVNVDSLEELDDRIQAYPLTPYSETQTIPLGDIDHALSTWGEQLKRWGIIK